MIVDCQSDYEHAILYDVCDAATLVPLTEEYDRMWYADDSKGVIRRYLQTVDGLLMLAYESDPQVPLDEGHMVSRFEKINGEVVNVTPPMCIAWQEEKRPIRIIRKADHAN